MNNILIINQPLGNRGDESAHRALVRNLNEALPNVKITILFVGYKKDAVDSFVVDHPNNLYVNYSYNHNLASIDIAKWGMRLGMPWLAAYIHPRLHELLKHYRQADIVLSAPGGICMGGFQNWLHLFYLYLTKHYKKPLIYYSRSFGPFPTDSFWNKRFTNFSLDILRYFAFLSIRDKQTMQLADILGVPYVPAIDTAFLDVPKVKLPEFSWKNDDYVVFVPNSLTWHFAYKKYTQKVIDNFYIKLIQIIHYRYPNHRIIMLPQLCNCGEKGDYHYFVHLKELSNEKDRIVVVPETYSSDVQQAIVRNASFMIGARYHSIVFAINNQCPFIALNYEHKIVGLLELLNLSTQKVDIMNIFDNEISIQNALQNIELCLNQTQNKLCASQKDAHYKARNCFESLLNIIE